MTGKSIKEIGLFISGNKEGLLYKRDEMRSLGGVVVCTSRGSSPHPQSAARGGMSAQT